MLNLYLLAAVFIMLSGINEATYPRRSFHDIYYPLRKDESRIQPFIQDIMIMEHQKPEYFQGNVLNHDNNNANLLPLLPNYNKLNKRSNYDEGNVGKRVYLARVGKRQYYAARIG